MLFSLGHGQKAFAESELKGAPAEIMEATKSLNAVVAKKAPGGTQFGEFRYYFPNAPQVPHDDQSARRLDALADAMIEGPGSPHSENSSIAPIFTYFGQFIDHDITCQWSLPAISHPSTGHGSKTG
jgi:hypothetical protein